MLERKEADDYVGRPPAGWALSTTLVPGATDAPSFQVNLREGDMHTVQFDTQIPPTQGNPVIARAEVIWTVQGNGVRRLLNIGHGTAISGTGSSVNVKLFDFSLAGTVASYLATAQVCKGTRPTNGQGKPPTLQTFDDNATGIVDVRGSAALVVIAAGGSYILRVPNDAGITALLINAIPPPGAAGNLVGNDVTVRQVTLSGVELDQFNYNQCGTWMPMAPACDALIIKNNSAGNVSVTPTWGLSG